MPTRNNAAAVAALQFALDEGDDDPIAFLRCWFEGDFEAIRAEWPKAPEAVFIGADPLHPETPEQATESRDAWWGKFADLPRFSFLKVGPFDAVTACPNKGGAWVQESEVMELVDQMLEAANFGN